MQTLTSGLMVGLTYGVLLVMGAVALPTAVVSRAGALWWCKTYAGTIFWLMRRVSGIRYRIEGPVPTGDCIIAANHQSFLDVLLLVHTLPRPRFVMKRSLLWVPVLGYFASRIGCVAIDRAKPGAIGEILGALRTETLGQMVIYPQGTRVPPGRRVTFRSGVLAMHRQSGLPVELAATNAGRFWPGRGVIRHPGTATMRFLGAADTGAPNALATMQDRIETAASMLEPG